MQLQSPITYPTRKSAFRATQGYAYKVLGIVQLDSGRWTINYEIPA